MAKSKTNAKELNTSSKSKNIKNLDASSVSETDTNISVINKPTPKGSKSSKVLMNSITNMSVSLEANIKPKSKKGEISTVDKDNSKLQKRSERKSILGKVVGNITEMMTKKVNQKVKATKDNQSSPIKENVKAALEDKRRRLSSSQSSPNK